jgi:hypothetical protein
MKSLNIFLSSIFTLYLTLTTSICHSIDIPPAYVDMAEEKDKEYMGWIDKQPDKKRWEMRVLFGMIGKKAELENLSMRILDKTGLTITLHREKALIEFSDKKESVFFEFGSLPEDVKKDACPEYSIKIQKATEKNVFLSFTCKELSGKIKVRHILTGFMAFNIEKKLMIDSFINFETIYGAVDPTPNILETPTGYKLKWKGEYVTYNPRITTKAKSNNLWTWKKDDLVCIMLDDQDKKIYQDPSLSSSCGFEGREANVIKPISIIKK